MRSQPYIRFLLVALTILSLIGPVLYLKFTGREFYPAVILPIGSETANYSEGVIGLVRNKYYAVDSRGVRTYIPDIASVLPDGMGFDHPRILLEETYREQQMSVKNERVDRRLRIRRKLLVDWLDAKGYKSSVKLLMVLEPMRLHLSSGRLENHDTVMIRTLRLDPDKDSRP
jgi:hypothetical protein